MKREIRIPMTIFTPKSLLRHPRCISTLDDLENGQFEEVIDDTDVDVESVTRLVFCTGKIYYELLERKEELKARDVAIVRIEQIHPFPKEKIEAIVAKYSSAILTLWVQEEPENMGGLDYINSKLKDHHITPIARLASASPATGLAATPWAARDYQQSIQALLIGQKTAYCNLDWWKVKVAKRY